MENEDKEKTTSGEVVSKETDKQIVKQDNNVVNIDRWIAGREEFMAKVAMAMKVGLDYHIIKEKKSLAKGGAEKIASIFKWSASFIQDEETYKMFGSTPGLIVYKCVLKQGTKIVGEGRGASSLQKNASDPNKTIKMAQKSAYIDAVIRTSGLSDIFTQDLEDMQEFRASKTMQPPPAMPAGKVEVMQNNPPAGIPQAVNPEHKMNAYIVLKGMINSSKSLQELKNVIPSIEDSKQKGNLSNSEISMLRGLFKGKEATFQ